MENRSGTDLTDEGEDVSGEGFFKFGKKGERGRRADRSRRRTGAKIDLFACWSKGPFALGLRGGAEGKWFQDEQHCPALKRKGRQEGEGV